MKAVWFEGGEATFRDIPVPIPTDGEALCRLRVAGICRTDLELLDGYMGFAGVPGHEFVAEVVEAADQELVGRRVVGDINAPCGACRLCHEGLPHHCPARTVLGIKARQGCFAEYFTLPAANLYPLEKGRRDYDAVFAEPLAAALQILEQTTPCERVLVVGDGKLGLLVAMVLRLSGSSVSLRGHHDDHLEAVRRVGVHRDPGGTFPMVVDCTGAPEGFHHSLERLIPGGTLVLKSTFNSPISLDLASVVVQEVSIVGSRCGPMDKALEWMKRRDVYDTLSKLRTHEFPFEDALKALHQAGKKGTLKVVLDNLG